MASIGRYTQQRTSINNVTTSSSIPDPAVHTWVSVGLRMVIFP